MRVEDSYAQAVPELSTPWRAADFPAPAVAVLNEPLAVELGFDPDWLRSEAGLSFLLGRGEPPVQPVAQAYAGHQFGGYSPRLGDGRALLVGELVDEDGRRRDLHLKGSGVTPYARGGDGKAALGPMLREFLVSEAMHALGLPTTRSLAVLSTGEQVFREGPQPGAVLCRIAASHLRVGTFQYAAASGDRRVLSALAEYAIRRHHPAAAEADRPALALYEAVARAQAVTVAGWMGVGFVHGVMNTDNMTISGETIDYGPCAFMEVYDPGTVFSSIDHAGRYAYGRQPGAAQWNLARLGEALLPLIDERPEAAVAAATEVLTAFPGYYDEAFDQVMARKIGVRPECLGAGAAAAGDVSGGDPELVRDLLALLAEYRVDFTSFFAALDEGVAAARELFSDPAAFERWAARRAAVSEGVPATGRTAGRVNPRRIPRNHRVEEVLAAAVAGDLGPFERLAAAVADPYAERAEWAEFAAPGPTDAPRYVTYCGT